MDQGSEGRVGESECVLEILLSGPADRLAVERGKSKTMSQFVARITG